MKTEEILFLGMGEHELFLVDAGLGNTADQAGIIQRLSGKERCGAFWQGV